MESLKLDGMLHDKNIESTPEYMRKLFIMPDSSDRFGEFGVPLLDRIQDCFKAASILPYPWKTLPISSAT